MQSRLSGLAASSNEQYLSLILLGGKPHTEDGSERPNADSRSDWLRVLRMHLEPEDDRSPERPALTASSSAPSSLGCSGGSLRPERFAKGGGYINTEVVVPDRAVALSVPRPARRRCHEPAVCRPREDPISNRS
jgi:hypothetical protein